ncbi:TPA: AAA family ATPase [Streptococcus suis]|nr:AAA family ATPase [Streptococcus suis]HEL2049165.1 AAA family ATPase [Streptococcus suis]HEM2582129.1 AAA family ATPase [Streptococcus suis]
MKLETFTFKDLRKKESCKEVEIRSINTVDDSNYYTVFIGENGVGKTRIFEGIIKNILAEGLFIRSEECIQNVNYSGEIKKIIFSTYTLFNRELSVVSEKCDYYKSNFNSKSIVRQVSQTYFKQKLNNGEEQKILEVLKHVGKILGLESEPRISVRGITSLKYDILIKRVRNPDLKFDRPSVLRTNIQKRKKILPLENIEIFEKKLTNFNKSSVYSQFQKYKNKFDHLDSIDRKYCYLSLLTVKSMLIYHRQKYQYSMKNQNIYNISELIDIYKQYFEVDFETAEELLRIDYAIAKELKIEFVDDLAFFNGNDSKLITQFSSGEFAFFTRLLELAVNITDNSLVLIDEPETFLNPKWVFEFVNLLKNIFKNKGCHFIIASQSPFVVGSVKKEDIVKVRRDGLGHIYFENEENQTLGARFDTLLSDIFGLNLDDNKVAEEFIYKIREVASTDIIKSIEMLSDLAGSQRKMDLILELSSEENIRSIEQRIADLEKEYLDEQGR